MSRLHHVGQTTLMHVDTRSETDGSNLGTEPLLLARMKEGRQVAETSLRHTPLAKTVAEHATQSSMWHSNAEWNVRPRAQSGAHPR